MFLLRAIVVWFIIMVAESIHGTLRTLYLEPWLGSMRARQVSVFTGCILIFVITMLCIRWIDARRPADLLAVGLVWVICTLVFEFTLGRILGFSWERMIEDYDIRRGGLMAVGLLFMLFAPYIAARLRGIRAKAAGSLL